MIGKMMQNAQKLLNMESNKMPESFKNRLTTTSKNRCKNKAACPELPGGSAARAGAPLTHLIISSRLVFVSFLSCLPRSRLRFVRKSKRLLKNADRSIAKATDATHIVVRRSLVSGCEFKGYRLCRRPLRELVLVDFVLYARSASIVSIVDI